MKNKMALSLLFSSMMLSSTLHIFADHHQEIKELKAKNAQYEQEIKDLKEKKEGWGYWTTFSAGAGSMLVFLGGIAYGIKKLSGNNNDSKRTNH